MDVTKVFHFCDRNIPAGNPLVLKMGGFYIHGTQRQENKGFLLIKGQECNPCLLGSG